MSELYGFDLLAQKRQAALMGGGKEKQDAQHAMSKLTARERIVRLLDAQSFVEMDAFAQHSNAVDGLGEISAPGEGVITGYGTIAGRGVYVFSQDYTVLGGAMGAMHARKILKVLSLAGKTGLPVIAMLDSMGARLGEGAGALEGFGQIFSKISELSGVVPIISIICGRCAGTAAFFAPLSDFVIMTKGISGLYTAAPGSFGEEGITTDPEAIGGAEIQSEKTGIAHFVCSDEDNAFNNLKQLLSYLPDNNLVDAPIVESVDDLNRQIQNYSADYDIREMISSVMDSGVFFETQALFATGILTGFGRINGRSIGVVANNPGSYLDTETCEKASNFVSFCDAFGLPVITFTDTPGFVKDLNQEQRSLIQSGAKLMYAYAEATVPMVNVITGGAIGSGYVAMSPKSMGADMVFAWPESQISCLPAEASAVVIMSGDISDADKPVEARKAAADIYSKTFASPWEAAKMGYVDEVIYPSETRQRIIGALELAVGKRESKLPKKHGTRLF
ncbi:MAG: acyl-CoA carboxylase subunit beta [Christensenellales bacterium]|jgi:acetyl-CoA carboxylase carboxyltransferase component